MKRRDFVKWSTPLAYPVILPVHAQTSPTTGPDTEVFSCGSITADTSMAFPSGVITGISAVLSPVPDRLVLMSYRVTSSEAGVIMFESAHIDAGGTVVFSDVNLPNTLTPGSQIVIEVFQDPTDTPLLDFTTCSLDITVSGNPISDRRLKYDIQYLKTSSEGIKLYHFRYLNDPQKIAYVGVMAQDLLESHPDAIKTDKTGYYRVNYDSLGVRMTKYDDW